MICELLLFSCCWPFLHWCSQDAPRDGSVLVVRKNVNAPKVHRVTTWQESADVLLAGPHRLALNVSTTIYLTTLICCILQSKRKRKRMCKCEVEQQIILYWQSWFLDDEKLPASKKGTIIRKFNSFWTDVLLKWSPIDVETACPEGFYGDGCTEVCQCNSGTDCDHVTGQCKPKSAERIQQLPIGTSETTLAFFDVWLPV